MLFQNIFLPLSLLTVAALGTPVALASHNGTSTDMSGPTPPQLKWLYTAYALCPADLLDGALTPAGIRKEIPISGGNFTGPGINGKFRSLGADWGTVSPISHLPLRSAARESIGPRSSMRGAVCSEFGRIRSNRARHHLLPHSS